MRAVFDTNILVAAFLTEGVCSKLLTRARKGECDLVLSRDILEELQSILSGTFSLSQREFREVRILVTEAATEIVDQVTQIKSARRDPDDDTILACAQSVEADYIVTGDKDLLVLERHGETIIVTPREFEALYAD
jgi:uncharacterized protein